MGFQNTLHNERQGRVHIRDDMKGEDTAWEQKGPQSATVEKAPVAQRRKQTFGLGRLLTGRMNLHSCL